MTIDGDVLKCNFYGCRAEGSLDMPSLVISPELHHEIRQTFAERGWASKRRDRWSEPHIDFCPDHIPKRPW